MAGLLDPKSRVLDTIITPEGRRQMFSGGMRIAYATFSDIGCPYDGDPNNIFISSSYKFLICVMLYYYIIIQYT